MQEGSRPSLRLTEEVSHTTALPGNANSLLVMLLIEQRVGSLLLSQQWLSEEGRGDSGNKRVKSLFAKEIGSPKDGW